MTLQWLARKAKKKHVYNRMADITFINEYKQSQKRSFNTPAQIPLIKRNIIIGTWLRRQSFNELKTIKAVENCQRVVACQIEELFEQKEKMMTQEILTEIINKKIKLTQIFDDNDLEKIYKEAESVIRHELLVRFNTLIVWNIKRVHLEKSWVAAICKPIEEYQTIKNRTVRVTSMMEGLSRKALNDTIELLVNNSLLNEALDLSALVLEKLDLNSRLELIEFRDELFNRIKGALLSIKLGLVQEINQQIANTFYETHDMFASRIGLKIILLDEKIANKETYTARLLEA